MSSSRISPMAAAFEKAMNLDDGTGISRTSIASSSTAVDSPTNGVFYFTGDPNEKSTTSHGFDPDLDDFGLELLNSYELMTDHPKAMYDSFTNKGFPGYDPDKELFDSFTDASFLGNKNNEQDDFAMDLEEVTVGFHTTNKKEKDDYAAAPKEVNEAAELAIEFPGYMDIPELPEVGWKEFDDFFSKPTVKRTNSKSKAVKNGGITKSAMKKKGSVVGEKKKKNVTFSEKLARVVPEIRYGVEFDLDDCPYYA